MKPVSLTVHKNNLERRKRKELREEMTGAVKELNTDLEVAGYVLIAWDDDYNADAYWDGGTLPSQVLPALVTETLRRKINTKDAERVIQMWTE